MMKKGGEMYIPNNPDHNTDEREDKGDESEGKA